MGEQVTNFDINLMSNNLKEKSYAAHHKKQTGLAGQFAENQRVTDKVSFTSAFSLVELSIVLVVLGLLTGGILTGQNLIRAAELRSVTTEFQAYQTAAMTFRDSYLGLPGDLRNASDFWGAMTNCGAASPSGTGTQTCSGNGNGEVNQAGAANQTGENYGFWQQLANAGLLEGSYTGISGSGGGNHSLLGVNVPASKLSNAGWSVSRLGNISAADTNMFPGSYGNALVFGAQSTSGWSINPILSPEEAWNLDVKIDDGKPETGKVRPREINAGTGTTHCSNTTTREYAYQNTGQLCSFIFLEVF